MKSHEAYQFLSKKYLSKISKGNGEGDDEDEVVTFGHLAIAGSEAATGEGSWLDTLKRFEEESMTFVERDAEEASQENEAGTEA